MLIGTGLMLLGVIFPLLMVIQVIEASFWLSFLTQAFSVVGLFLGFFGIFNYVHNERKK